MRTSLLGFGSLVGILAATMAVAIAQSSGQSMSGLTLNPIPKPGPAPYVLHIPTPSQAQTAQELEARTAKELRTRVAKEWLAHAANQMPAAVKPTVVCGIMVLPADAAIDSAILKAAPQDKVYTIKTIQPSSCSREQSPISRSSDRR